VKADSIAALYYDQDPTKVGLVPEDYFRYEVKLVEVQTEEEFQANVEKMKVSMKIEAKRALDEYVVNNNINVTPEPSGVYIIPIEKGKGRCPVKGEKVELDFSATLLNGQPVGSTFDSPEKFSFVLGEGYTIQGWEEIVPKMHLGDRVKAIIPFDMAYGEHSVGEIPAYANLVYDIKLLKITTAAELQAEAERALKALKEESERAFFDYLKVNNITDYTASGLFFAKSLVTEGAQPQKGQTARIKFEASYLDGTPLGDSEQLGGQYDLVIGEGKVLKGLEEGVSLMRVGEKARFVLPYTLAYGANPYGNIPAYSNLVFDVELLDVLDK
jgi:FKBP-type peptidyl-prolyl cis-trans isomerase